jgi:hypothetical protein
MVESIHNTENKPQNQHQDNDKKEVNISILIRNAFHDRSGWVLKPYLPRNRSISIYTKQIKQYVKHLPNEIKIKN